MSHGSLRGTLVHILSTEWIWHLRCQESLSPPSLLTEERFPALEVLQTRWREEEDAWRAFLEGLGDEALQRVVHYSNTKYEPEIAAALAKWMPPGSALEPLILFRTLFQNPEISSRMRPLGAGILGPHSSLDPRERLLIQLVDELYETAMLTDEIWEQVATGWSAAQILEMLIIIGWYHLIPFVANATCVEQEPWAARFPPLEKVSSSQEPNERR